MRPKILTVLLGAATLLFSSCAPDAPESNEPAPALQHTSASILTPSSPNGTITSSLNCGCPFAIGIDTIGGDSAVIRYAIPTKDTELSSHTITVTALTSGLASGTYTSWLAIRTPDPRVTFLRDTIRDTLIVP